MKKYKFKIIVLFFLAHYYALFFGWIPPANAMENFNPAVVKIWLYDPVLEQYDTTYRNNCFLGQGTGFIMTGDGIIFTSASLVEWCTNGYIIYDAVLRSGEKIFKDKLTYLQGIEFNPSITQLYYAGYTIPIVQVFISSYENDYKLFIAKVLALGQNYDGAVLQIVSDINNNPVNQYFTSFDVINKGNFYINDSVYALGYSTLDKSFKQRILNDNLTKENGKIINLLRRHSSLFYTTIKMNQGMCGGPVLNYKNELLGIACLQNSFESETSYVENIEGMFYVSSNIEGLSQRTKKNGWYLPSMEYRISVQTGSKKPIPDFLSFSLYGKKNEIHSPFKKCNIKGLIRSADTGKPIKDAKINLYYQDKPNKKLTLIGSTVCIRSGFYNFNKPYPSGPTYTLNISAKGYNEIIYIFKVNENKQEPINITMVKKR